MRAYEVKTWSSRCASRHQMCIAIWAYRTDTRLVFAFPASTPRLMCCITANRLGVHAAVTGLDNNNAVVSD